MKLRKKALATFLLAAATLVINACGASKITTTTTSSPEDGLTVTYLDVGKADAILLQQEDSNVLIDTGTADGAEELVQSLKDLKVDDLDCLVLTHFDQDHVGGAADVLEAFNTDRVITTYESKESDEIDAYHQAMTASGLEETLITTGETMSFGDAEFTIYPPASSTYEQDTSNNSSLVVRVTYGEKRFLFCGDVEKERIKEMRSDDIDLSADVIKMPHHGRYEKVLKDLVNDVAPEYAIISTSLEEADIDKTCEVLEAAGVKTLITYDGNVTIHTDGKTLTVDQ